MLQKKYSSQISHVLRLTHITLYSLFLVFFSNFSSKLFWFRIVHCGGFSAEEFAKYGKIAVDNTLGHVDTLLKAMKKLNISFVQPDAEVREENSRHHCM